MTLTTIALQDLRRRKGRTTFLLLTFCLITAIIVGLQALSTDMSGDLERSLTRYGANIIITPRSEHLSLSYSGISIPGVSYDIEPLSNNILTTIKQDSESEIIEIAPKVIGKVEGPDKRFLIVGVDFPTELKIKPWWTVIGSQPGSGQIVVGASLAKEYNLTTGSTFKVNGKSHQVSGVMQETGSSEDQAIFSDISTARTLTDNEDSWSLIELNSQHPDLTLSRLSPQLPSAKVSEISQLVQGTRETINRFNNYALFSSLLLIIIGILTLAITLTATINSRISEFGIFRAIGFRQSHILSLLFRQIAILSFCGGLLGYFLGVAAPLILGPLIFQKVFAFNFFPLFAVSTEVASFFAACISIAVPAWQATRNDPLESLNHI